MKLHLVHGHSAGGSLRLATREFGLSGKVLVIDDYLSIGPLCDDRTRHEFWRSVYEPYPEVIPPDLYEQWREISKVVASASEVILWSSESACGYVFERMAAFILGDRTPLCQVLAPAHEDLHGVEFFGPAALADMEGRKREITGTAVSEWSTSFENQLSQSNGIRVLRQGSLVTLPYNALDEYLLARCPLEWTPWNRPIAQAMADCDGQNLIHDPFFSWRLGVLIEAGRLEAKDRQVSPDGLRRGLVRRVEVN